MRYVSRVNPPQSTAELLERAQQIAGLRILDLAQACAIPVPPDLRRHKGWLGQLLETCLGASAGSRPEPDFPALQIELKTLPINRYGKPCESTFVCSVPLTGTTLTGWENSWVWLKLQQVLWIPVEADPEIPLAQRHIGSAILWRPNAEQAEVLRQDWEELMDLIYQGELEKISAKHGTYLQIRPKAANARALCDAIDAEGSRFKTLPRGFYLRPQFTAQILASHYIAPA